jgi:hypothetical protein
MSALITLLFLAVIGWNTFTQIMARQQTSISCSYDVATARKIVSQSFGMWWKAVPGKGADNYKSKRGSNAPTLSISYGMAESGGCDIDIWCSQGTKRYGVLNHAQLVWRKKRAVAGALARAELTHSQARTQPGRSETVSVGSPRPHPTAQPAIDANNHFGLVGADRVSRQTPDARIGAGSVPPVWPDGIAEVPGAGPGVTRPRPLPVREMTGAKAESVPAQSSMQASRGIGSTDGSSIMQAWLNELEAAQPQHGPLLQSTLAKVGNLPAVSDDGSIYTVSHNRYWYAAGYTRSYTSLQANHRRIAAVLAEAKAKETRDEPTMVRKEAEAEFWESVQGWVDSSAPSRTAPDVMPDWLTRFNPVWNPAKS